jgi:enoyl-[acyl-carrier-protein] reductase (NADH)
VRDLESGVDRHELMGRFSVLSRGPRLEEVSNVAVFLASDLASATTGAILNVTAGVVF